MGLLVDSISFHFSPLPFWSSAVQSCDITDLSHKRFVELFYFYVTFAFISPLSFFTSSDLYEDHQLAISGVAFQHNPFDLYLFRFKNICILSAWPSKLDPQLRIHPVFFCLHEDGVHNTHNVSID
jgi:hypothetical protein